MYADYCNKWSMNTEYIHIVKIKFISTEDRLHLK